jgi:hypothetical protein
MREKAIAEYHDLLVADESLNAELFARLKNAMTANRLLYGRRALGVSLRPHLLTRSQYRVLEHRARVLAGALEKVAAAMLSNPALMDRIGMSEAEKRLVAIHPGYSRAAVTTRLDGFLLGDQMKFVEYNAENPSSLTDQAGLTPGAVRDSRAAETRGAISDEAIRARGQPAELAHRHLARMGRYGSAARCHTGLGRAADRGRIRAAAQLPGRLRHPGDHLRA